MKKVGVIIFSGFLGAFIPLIILEHENSLVHASLTVVGLLMGNLFGDLIFGKKQTVKIKEIKSINVPTKENGQETIGVRGLYVVYIISVVLTLVMYTLLEDKTFLTIISEQNLNPIISILALSLFTFSTLTGVGKWLNKGNNGISEVVGFCFTHTAYCYISSIFIMLVYFLIDWLISNVVGIKILTEHNERVAHVSVFVFAAFIFIHTYDDVVNSSTQSD